MHWILNVHYICNEKTPDFVMFFYRITFYHLMSIALQRSRVNVDFITHSQLIIYFELLWPTKNRKWYELTLSIKIENARCHIIHNSWLNCTEIVSGMKRIWYCFKSTQRSTYGIVLQYSASFPFQLTWNPRESQMELENKSNRCINIKLHSLKSYNPICCKCGTCNSIS